MRRLALPVVVIVAVVVLVGFRWSRSVGSTALSASTASTASTTAGTVETDKTDRDSIAKAPPRTRRVLFGEVVDPDGQPIPGAQIALKGHDGTSRSAVADADGQFTFDDVPAANTEAAPETGGLHFSAPGFVDVDVDAQTLPTTAEAFWSQTLVFDPSQPMLLVQDATSGAPIANVLVFQPVTGTAGKLRLQPLGQTGPSGRVMVPPAQPSAPPLALAHAGRGVVDVPQRDIPTAGQRIVKMPAAAELRLVVRGDGARVVAGAVVRAFPAAIDLDDHIERQAYYSAQRRQGPPTTGEDGTLNLPAPAGKVELSITAEGYRPFQGALSTSTRDQVVQLERSPTISGLVLNASTQKPVPGAIVDVDGGARTRTDKEGHFTLTSLPDRPTSLTVSARGYQKTVVGGVLGDTRPGRGSDDVVVELPPGKGSAVVGIGVRVAPATVGVLVAAVEPNTPAEAAGLGVDDVIITVDGEKLDGDLGASMGRIRGAPGTSVRLGVQRPSGRVDDVVIERAAIRIR